MRVAINGFGRIGRGAFKALLENKNPEVEIVAINDLTDNKTLAHLFQYDSCYGIFPQKVDFDDANLFVDEKKYKVFSERDPANLPWQELGVDIVIESTGIFRDRAGAEKHIQAGAQKVIISAPAKDALIKNIVLGVNGGEVKKNDKVISMASCTTNCLAPVTDVIRKKFGIKKAIMTTIHSYTADQRIVDGPHKDLRRARAAAINIIPTTTGAAKATTEVIPELADKFDGISMRVPTPTGSLCDIIFVVDKKTNEKELNQELTKASKSAKYKGILAVTDKELVSQDFVGNPASAIVDLALTKVIDGDLAKIIAWYDNERGYSSRLADLCNFIANKKLY